MQKIHFVVFVVCLFAVTALAQSTQDNSSPSQEKAAGSVAVSGEPTSQQMRDAVQTTIDSYNSSMKQKVDACRNGQYNGNPLQAAQCMAVYANGSNDKNDYMIKITKFKKLECASAQSAGKAGYNCDYVLNLSENTPALLGVFGITSQGGGKTQGRFVHTDDGWILITDTDK
jgi:hypothetical protein